MKDKQLSYLNNEERADKKYYCPKCDTQLLIDFDIYCKGLEGQDIMSKAAIHSAVLMISNTNCPDELLRDLWRWLHSLTDDFSQEQSDKLKLLKWKQASNES